MDSVGWDATGRPLTDQLVHELAQHQPEYHPLRQLYREALTNQLSVQSAVLAVCILVIMFWATRLFLRFMFWLFDRVNDWRTGGVVVLAPFESQVIAAGRDCCAARRVLEQLIYGVTRVRCVSGVLGARIRQVCASRANSSGVCVCRCGDVHIVCRGSRRQTPRALRVVCRVP